MTKQRDRKRNENIASVPALDRASYFIFRQMFLSRIFNPFYPEFQNGDSDYKGFDARLANRLFLVFWLSDTLALNPERQSAREVKN